jgi:hypothetical protein
MNQLTDKYKNLLPDKGGRCLVVYIKRIGEINGYCSTYQMIKADCSVVCSVSKNLTDGWMWDNRIDLMWDNHDLIKLK